MTEVVSKKGAKKADKAAAKELRKQEKAAQNEAAIAALEKYVDDITVDAWGYLPFRLSCGPAPKVPRAWTKIAKLDKSLATNTVWLRGRLQESRIQGPMGFVVLRGSPYATVQLVVDASVLGDRQAVKFVKSISPESVVDVFGTVNVPAEAITSTTQQVEVQVQKFFCFSKAHPLPFQLKDAARVELGAGADPAEGHITVGQDTRLDNRVLDLRTPANQAIMRIQSMTGHYFREFLLREEFTEIHSPKIIPGVSEGGANAFTLKYFGRPACLAQSPQLYKQMAICGDLGRVFEIGPVFRAENSNTHRHLCEFVGVDVEMTIHESYHEILDMVNDLFVHIFEGLVSTCGELIKTVAAQYESSPLKWVPQAPRITYEEGIQMLRDAGAAGIPDDTVTYDLSTENEKLLGKLVKDKYDTDFYMLIRYPLGVRPFYTMPDPDDNRWSNSYDIFIRGEEIISGAQRVHCPELLTQRAQAHGIDVATLQSYIDAFKLGAFPHGGVGIGLERVVMLILGLNNIRKVSMFPRDPKRLAP